MWMVICVMCLINIVGNWMYYVDGIKFGIMLKVGFGDLVKFFLYFVFYY